MYTIFDSLGPVLTGLRVGALGNVRVVVHEAGKHDALAQHGYRYDWGGRLLHMIVLGTGDPDVLRQIECYTPVAGRVNTLIIDLCMGYMRVEGSAELHVYLA